MSDHDEDEDLSPEELAAAEALATQVDDLVAGKGLPAAGAGEERELLQMSSMIRAAHREIPLAADRQAALIEEAMAQALPGTDKAGAFAEVHSLDAARARRRRAWSVGIAGVVAVAAIALLWFRTQSPTLATSSVATRTPIPQDQQSRASDELIGQIAPEQSGMASSRIDQIYGDRMGGYRALQYSRLVGKQ